MVLTGCRLLLGDCLEVLRTMPDASVDAVVTDPPYGLAFMGKRWDYDVPTTEVWAECLRVLKPGGHLLAFAGTRTQHRMAVRIEDAGFEIRDMIAWVYGSGYRKVGYIKDGAGNHILPGFGGSLKPALEPITMARKPLSEGTLAANVLAHGTGGINVDGCRVGTEARPVMVRTKTVMSSTSMTGQTTGATSSGEMTSTGRWPANLIHDGSDEVVELFPQQQSGANPTRRGGLGYHGAAGQDTCHAPRGTDTGSASRFFYMAKARGSGRDPGNTHPTVKPLELMAYLCRLVTPPQGLVLDPFMGSGTTGKAAMGEGFRFVGIEQDPAYLAIAEKRLNGAQIGLPL